MESGKVGELERQTTAWVVPGHVPGWLALALCPSHVILLILDRAFNQYQRRR